MSRSSIFHRAVFFNCACALLIILRSLAPTGGALTRASSMLAQCRFDPNGSFYIKGGSPKGFEEFDYIELNVKEKSGPGRALESHLKDKKGKSYRFTKLGEFQTHSSGSGITFEFTTETIKGVNYQFSGKLVSICVLAQDERDPEKVVARGTLLKFKKGQKKIAAEVELTYSKSPRSGQ